MKRDRKTCSYGETDLKLSIPKSGEHVGGVLIASDGRVFDRSLRQIELLRHLIINNEEDKKTKDGMKASVYD